MKMPKITLRSPLTYLLFIQMVAATTPLYATEPGQQTELVMAEYLDFAPYHAGIIIPQQISDEVAEQALFIDTRSADQYAAATLPGAINIEWRQVLNRRSEIPTDQMVILFCNTGSLSAQATFALRVLGHENVLVLQSGFEGWLRYQATAK